MRALVGGILVLFALAMLAAFVWLVGWDRGELIIEGPVDAVELDADAGVEVRAAGPGERLVLPADRSGAWRLRLLSDGRAIACEFRKNAREDILIRIGDGVIQGIWMRGSDLSFWYPIATAAWGAKGVQVDGSPAP